MSWTIIEEFKGCLGNSTQRRTLVEVVCSCGAVETRRKDHVVSGRTTGCKSCSSKLTAKKFPPPVVSKAIEDFSGTHYSTYKIGAYRRGIKFNVEQQFLWDMFISQDKKCALTGVPITLSKALTPSKNVDYNKITASLDRIDSSIGYIESNVQWVHKDINRFKNAYSMDDFIYMCSMVLKHHGDFEPSQGNSIKVLGRCND